MQFTDKGADKFAEITREIAERGRRLSNFSGGQKIVQTFAIVLDREIKSYPSIDWEQYPNGISGTNGAQITGIGGLQEAKDLALVLQTGALPVTFTTLETTAISATLGKDSLREAWRAAIGRPPRRRALPAHLLPRARRRRGDRARHLRGVPLRGDPDLQRHADPAGLRRDHPDTGGGRRREHRHLRAREGGVPRRKIGARRDSGGLRQGLRDDRRRQRRHRDHGDGALPGGDRGSQGLRADAPDRNADLAADRSRGDARDPRPARRLQLVRQPEADGSRGRAAGVDPARLHRPPQPLVRDLRRRARDLGRRDRRQGPEPRHRLRGRHEDHVHDAPAGLRSRTFVREASRARRGHAQIVGRGTAVGGDSYRSFRSRARS